MSGWIKIHRSITKWEWFDEPNVFMVFMYLLLKASHNDLKWRGKKFSPGQLPFGSDKAAIETGLTRSKIRTAISKLEATNEITIKTSNQGTVITINNWDKYQNVNQQNDQQYNQRIANGSPTDRQRIATTKNLKNLKNEKNLKNTYVQDIKNLWNDAANNSNLKRCKVLSDKRKKQISKTISTLPEMATPKDWELYFKKITESDFLCGGGNTGWIADFDWAIKPDNIIKVVEEKYNGMRSTSTAQRKADTMLSMVNPFKEDNFEG